MKIPTKLLSIFNFCDKNSKRYALGGVCVKQNENQSEVVATDGKSLIKSTFKTETKEDQAVIVAQDDWKELFTIAQKSKVSNVDLSTGEIPEESQPRDISLSATNNKTRELKTQSIVGRFPAYGEICVERESIESIEGKEVRVRLDAKKLITVLQTLVKCTDLSDLNSVELRISTETSENVSNKAIHIMAEDEDVKHFAVLMPLSK